MLGQLSGEAVVDVSICSLRTVFEEVVVMLHITKVSIVSPLAIVSFCAVFFCQCGTVLSEDTFAGGSTSGNFVTSPYGVSKGGWTFGFGGIVGVNVELMFSLKENVSPAVIYATSRTARRKKTFAYLLVVYHRYTGNETAEFPYRLAVADGTAEIEQSLRIGDSKFRIQYSLEPSNNHKRRVAESLKICNAPVELDHGRVFTVDMSSDLPVVYQVDYPFPNVLGTKVDSKTAGKVLRDLSERETARQFKKRLLELLPAQDESVIRSAHE